MNDKKAVKISSRPMQGDEDFWQVHRLLLDTVPITPMGFNWDMRRWEGKRFYDANPTGDAEWMVNGRLWHTASGQLVGAAHPEGSLWAAHLQVHPDYRHLEGEMIAWAQNHIVNTTKDGKKEVHFFVYEYDVYRQALLTAHGYEKMDYGGVIRYLRFGKRPLAQPKVAEGYTIRTTNPEDGNDCQKIAILLNAAFNRDFHTAAEYQQFTRNAPCFRRDLDLVAVAPDGSFASYVGIPYDEVNKRGIFEPVCTHPDHRQKGLGKALMQDGLLRLKSMGAIDVNVETGDMIPANRLYSSIGFTEMYKGFYWKKMV
ncbi:MAG: GNAT family N-acetyltransferase [Chloroflexi bacterium]|nr:GNAT family N-acetyltransferase [Chloroflexota bacterium]